MYLAGPDAVEAADWLFTANVDKEPGSIIYTCSLNSRGHVEADVTVIPLEEGQGTLVGPIFKVRFTLSLFLYLIFVPFREKVTIS